MTDYIELPDSVTISDVGEIHADLKQRLATNTPLLIDGSQVEVIDGAGTQLLAAFMKEAVEREVSVRWSKVSERLQQAADQLGLSSALMIDGPA